MFKGPGEGINIVPMDAKFNGSSGEWYNLEQQSKKALESNQSVKVNITPIYSGTSKRPTSFVVEQQINGRNFEPRTLQNSPTGK